MVKNIQLDSELPKNDNGRFYHIDCGPGDLAPYIITCGDPERAKKISRHFSKTEIQRNNREFSTYTGNYKGIPISVMSIGIGPGNAAIAIIESSQCVNNPTYIRLGTCGAIQNDIKIGDLVITEEALRYENVTSNYAPHKIRATSHPTIVKVLENAAKELGYRYHKGLTCTTSDFYAGQGRKVPGFPCLNDKLINKLQKKGVKNFEMEMSVHLILAKVSSYKIRAGGVCGVVADRNGKKFVNLDELLETEERCINNGLKAIELLYYYKD